KDSLSRDSIWMSADTLYSTVTTKGTLYKLKEARKPKDLPPDEVQEASPDLLNNKDQQGIDSLHVDMPKDSLNVKRNINADSVQVDHTNPEVKDMSKEKLPVL